MRRLPRIYQEVTGRELPGGDDGNGLRADDWALLRDLCGDDAALFELQVALLGVERQFRGMSRRAGIFDVLEERLRAGIFPNEQEAVAVLKDREKQRQERMELDLIAGGTGEEEVTTDEHRSTLHRNGRLNKNEGGLHKKKRRRRRWTRGERGQMLHRRRHRSKRRMGVDGPLAPPKMGMFLAMCPLRGRKEGEKSLAES